MNSYFADLDKSVQPASIVRLQNEQSNLRKLILRIHTIRDTSFIQSGYAIAEVVSLHEFFTMMTRLAARLGSMDKPGVQEDIRAPHPF